MKLLIDENLSHSLVYILRDLFPQSVHVRDLGLKGAPDTAIWTYARERNLIILTKDEDYRRLSENFSHPPKVLWISLGNCSTAVVGELVQRLHEDITSFVDDDGRGFLALG